MYYKISLFSYILYTVIWMHSSNKIVLTHLQALWLLVEEDNAFIFWHLLSFSCLGFIFFLFWGGPLFSCFDLSFLFFLAFCDRYDLFIFIFYDLDSILLIILILLTPARFFLDKKVGFIGGHEQGREGSHECHHLYGGHN